MKQLFNIIFLFLLILAVTGCNSALSSNTPVPDTNTPEPVITPSELGTPEWIFLSSSGGYDGNGDKNVGYDGITINTDTIVYYKNGKIIDTKKIVYKTGKSIRTGENKELLHIGGEDTMPSELVIDGDKMTLYDNFRDGYQYNFKKATSKE
ncbi:MAG: hypothetical protein ABRQ38_23650 [Candidatus Eremiobacterota bacterium]